MDRRNFLNSVAAGAAGAIAVPQLLGAPPADGKKQTEVEARTPESSSAENVSAAQWMKLTTQPCSMATPFGLPVEPEVYMTCERFDGRIAGCVLSSRRRAISSA